MTVTKIFPITLIVLDLLASIVYFSSGDVKRGIYWIAAMTLTITVTI